MNFQYIHNSMRPLARNFVLDLRPPPPNKAKAELENPPRRVSIDPPPVETSLEQVCLRSACGAFHAQAGAKAQHGGAQGAG